MTGPAIQDMTRIRVNYNMKSEEAEVSRLRTSSTSSSAAGRPKSATGRTVIGPRRRRRRPFLENMNAEFHVFLIVCLVVRSSSYHLSCHLNVSHVVPMFLLLSVCLSVKLLDLELLYLSIAFICLYISDVAIISSASV